MRIRIQQCLSGQQDTWRAETALDRSVIQEGLLERVQMPPLSQALHRYNLPPLQFKGWHQTGGEGLAVDQDSATPTIAGIAADLGAFEPQLVPQHLHQRGGGVNFQRHLLSVHYETQLWRHSFSLRELMSNRGALTCGELATL
jgi:hypothetical protein